MGDDRRDRQRPHGDLHRVGAGVTEVTGQGANCVADAACTEVDDRNFGGNLVEELALLAHEHELDAVTRRHEMTHQVHCHAFRATGTKVG